MYNGHSHYGDMNGYQQYQIMFGSIASCLIACVLPPSLSFPQGAFDQDECISLHSINPYGNRESRIVFSTWNLDHRWV